MAPECKNGQSLSIGALPVRGCMYSVSHGRMPKPETLYMLVDFLAHWGYNAFSLNVEHTFHFRKHPAIGKGWSPLTANDIVALQSYCGQRGVELIPSLQSFGHFEQILLLPQYRHLAETSDLWSLTPAKKDTYRLLDDMYGEYLPLHSSKLFNMCCDEVFDLHKGYSKIKYPRAKPGAVYVKHITKLCELSHKYGKRPMMWGDVVLHYPECIKDLPKDLIVLAWGYDQNSNFEMCEKYQASGLDFIVCPGTSSWNSLFPRIDNARKNISRFIETGRKYGTLGMFNCEWGDGGHYNFQDLSYYPLAYGGQMVASGIVPHLPTFERAFARYFGTDGTVILNASRQLDKTNLVIKGKFVNRSPVQSLFWKDGRPEKTVEALAAATPAKLRKIEAITKPVLAMLEKHKNKVQPQHAHMIRGMILAGRQTLFACNKTKLLRGFNGAPGPATLAASLKSIKKEFQSLWFEENKSGGFQVADKRYRELAKEIASPPTVPRRIKTGPSANNEDYVPLYSKVAQTHLKGRNAP